MAVSIPTRETLQAIEFDLDGHRIRLHPPLLAEITSRAPAYHPSIPAVEFGRAIRRSTDQAPTEYVKLDDASTIQANLLEIDILQVESSRLASELSTEQLMADAVTLGFRVASSFTQRLRSVVGGEIPSALDSQSASWKLEFLNDDGSELEPDPLRIRRRLGVKWSYHLIPLDSSVWARICELPLSYQPTPWHSLLIDAGRLLEHPGAAIVLAAAALETAVGHVLDELAARSTVPPLLWAWINDRGDFRKDPSVSDQFDQLLAILSGRSLKTDPALWEAFRNLKEARNTFVHEGISSIGGTPVDRLKAADLVGKARAITTLLESNLSPEQRAPSVTRPMNWELSQQLTPAGEK